MHAIQIINPDKNVREYWNKGYADKDMRPIWEGPGEPRHDSFWAKPDSEVMTFYSEGEAFQYLQTYLTKEANSRGADLHLVEIKNPFGFGSAWCKRADLADFDGRCDGRSTAYAIKRYAQ